MPQTIPATLIPGDGIGPEIMDATLAVLDAASGAILARVPVAGGVQAAPAVVGNEVLVAAKPLPDLRLQVRDRIAFHAAQRQPAAGRLQGREPRQRTRLRRYQQAKASARMRVDDDRQAARQVDRLARADPDVVAAIRPVGIGRDPQPALGHLEATVARSDVKTQRRACVESPQRTVGFMLYIHRLSLPRPRRATPAPTVPRA